MNVNESAENYLETILILSHRLPVVRSVDIANELGFKKSSVSIRKFCKFYNSRSYSCIYNTIKNYEKTIKKNNQN